ncbi:MAG: ABC transporter permease, partial [Chloroflexi bacterium]
MRALGDLVRWLTDPVNWQGSHGIPVRVLEHIELS